MSGGLLPATVATLRQARALGPLFPNAILAELFDAQHSRLPWRVLPRTDGKFALVDERRALGNRTVALFQDSTRAREALQIASAPARTSSPKSATV